MQEKRKEKTYWRCGGNGLLYYVAKPRAKLTEVGVSKICGTFFT